WLEHKSASSQPWPECEKECLAAVRIQSPARRCRSRNYLHTGNHWHCPGVAVRLADGGSVSRREGDSSCTGHLLRQLFASQSEIAPGQQPNAFELRVWRAVQRVRGHQNRCRQALRRGEI